jgi:hypothetical protein
MSDIAIRCEGLSKQYRIGKRERYRALRDVLTDSLSAPFRFIGSSFRNSKSDIRNSSPGKPAREGRDVLLVLGNRGKYFALNFLDQEGQVGLFETDASVIRPSLAS